jgi:hypothetical protein
MDRFNRLLSGRVPELGKRDDFIGGWNGSIRLAVEEESARAGKRDDFTGC